MDGGGSAQDSNFTINGSKAIGSADIGIAELMRRCLAENDRRFAGYDYRLCRPTTMPRMVRFALRFVRARKPRASCGSHG
jgi:hypothetical protein